MTVVASGLGAQFGMAVEPYTNEVQTISGTPSGTFGLVFDGANTVTTLATNASAASIQTALNNLVNLGNGAGSTFGVTCTGGPLPTTVNVTFSGTLVAARNVPQLSVQGAITGLTFATPTPGTGYGSGATATRFLEIDSESLGLDVGRIESAALRAGNRVLRTDRWVSGKRDASGDINFEVATTGFGLLFKQMFGASAITTPTNGVLTRDHTYTIADPTAQSQVYQFGRPDTNGNANPFTYPGGKIMSWELSTDIDGLLMLKVTVNCQDEQQTVALAAAAFPTQQPLSWVGGAISMGGANVGYCTKISVTGDLALNAGRYFQNNSVLKKEPLPNAFANLGGTVSLEFFDTSAYNRYVNGQLAQIVTTWTGPQIEAVTPTYFNTVQATIPNARFDGTTPNIAGADVLAFDQPFKALYDGASSPITLLYRTTDTVD